MRQKNVLKEPLQSDQEFSVFLKRVREESGVLGEMLVEGLMDLSALSKIEGGLRPVRKIMRNRLLGRMGVTPDMYENLLNNEDYAAWEWQQKILCAIDRKDFGTAGKLIAADSGQKLTRDKIKHQFCLVMEAEILKQQGADRAEISSRYETAVRLTVPKVEQFYTEEKLLSVQELNIVLEYEFYRKGNGVSTEDFAEKCRYLMKYVENSLYDELSKAKIYPKIAVYYLRDILSKGGEMTTASRSEALRYCNQAIEMLRDTGRAFYLVELLEYKRGLLTHIIKAPAENGMAQETEVYKTALQESAEIEDVLKGLYAEYGIPAYMQDCTYLYHQRWVFAIGDVLRIRRNMYGWTQQELCEGICSIKSLRRAEKKRVNMQREALEPIMRRLGLSKEIQKTHLVTNDREVLRLRTELANFRINREIWKVRELLNQLKKKVRLDIPENMQYAMEVEASMDMMEGKITRKEFVSREEAALQCTLPIEDLCDLEEIYLTEIEMSCIRQRMQWLEGTEKRKQIDFLIRFFEKYEKANMLADYIAMYEFVMMSVTSELGDMGEHELAIEMDKKVLSEVLKCRRICSFSDFVYDILWNEKEQKTSNNQQMDKEKMTDSLRLCLVFSHFCKHEYYEKIYSDKINQSTQVSLVGISLHGETDSSPV